MKKRYTAPASRPNICACRYQSLDQGNSVSTHSGIHIGIDFILHVSPSKFNNKTICTNSKLFGARGQLPQGSVFTPHLVPMTRGILATIYLKGRATTEQCLAAARKFYAGRPFVRVTDKPPHTKWATGSNLAFISYAADPQRDSVVAMGAVDNLGKGAAGQAIQNANLITGQPETAARESAGMWP